MKKSLCIVVLLCIMIASVSAGPVSFGIGNYARAYMPLSEGIDIERYNSPNNWSFGTEARLRLFFVELTANGTFAGLIRRDVADGPITSVTHNGWFDGMMTLGVNARLFGFLDIGTGFGPMYGFLFEPDEINILLRLPNGYWHANSNYTFADIFTDSLCAYRAHLDIRLGKLTFGVALEMPTVGFTFGSPDVEALDIDLDRSRVGLTAMYWLF